MSRRLTTILALTWGLTQSLTAAQVTTPTVSYTTPPRSAVTGYAQFPFGTPLTEVAARLQKGFPGQTFGYAKGFGRQVLRLREGLILNSEDADATFTFLNGQLTEVKLEVEGDERTLTKMNAFLGQRFGQAAPLTLSAEEQRLGRDTPTAYAQESVLLNTESTYNGLLITVTFRDPAAARQLRAQMDAAINLPPLQQLYEAGQWKKLPHEKLQGVDEFMSALTVGDTYERAALLGEGVTTRERAWAGAYFYVGLVERTRGELEAQRVLEKTAHELLNPLSMFLLGRLNFSAQTSDPPTPAQVATYRQGYFDMMNAYNLTSLLSEDLPQLSKLLADSHTGMLAGLANGMSDLGETDRKALNDSWKSFYSKFTQTYQVSPRAD